MELKRQPSRHGQQPHPELVNGPLEDRSCTDILCYFLFVFSFIALIAFGVYGFDKGQPLRLTYPYDPDGRACGIDTDVLNYPYIYLVTPFPDYLFRSVCVSSCPNSTDTQLKCIPNEVVPSCEENMNPEYLYPSISEMKSPSFQQFANNSVYIYDSKEFLGRICLPSVQTYLNYAKGALNINFIQQWVSDLEITWPLVFASAGIALLIGFVYMILMRYCSGLMVWLSILLYFILLIAIGYFCMIKSTQIKEEADQQQLPSDSDERKQAEFLYWFSIFLFIFAGLSFLLFICFFSKIKLAIAIIKSATIFIKDVPLSLLLPILFTFIMLSFQVLWLAIFVFVYSIGDIKGSPDSPLASIKWDPNIRYYLIFIFFIGIWTVELIHALQEFVIASTVSLWYFTLGTGQDVVRPISRSFVRGLFYHLGSLAFGSFVLALIIFLRFWLEYINKQMENTGAQNQQPLKCFLDCCRCYAAYFQRFIEFINKNAYIQISITGKNFCLAAKDAFYLIYENGGKFLIVDGIGHIFIIIGKCFIALFTAIACYQIEMELYQGILYSPFFPCFCCFIIAIYIGHIFMIIYGMAVDTILHCYCLDEELEKANQRPAQHCPEPLKQFFDEQENQ